jgi:hypothetical protein
MEKVVVLVSRDKADLKLDIKKYSNEWKCGPIRKVGKLWKVELIKNI